MSRSQCQRLVVYIRAFGMEPIAPKSPDYDAWLRNLQKQYEELRQQFPEEVSRVRSAGRAAIRSLGLVAASEPWPSLFTPRKGTGRYKASKQRLRRRIENRSQDVRLCKFCGSVQKLSHFLSKNFG